MLTGTHGGRHRRPPAHHTHRSHARWSNRASVNVHDVINTNVGVLEQKPPATMWRQAPLSAGTRNPRVTAADSDTHVHGMLRAPNTTQQYKHNAAAPYLQERIIGVEANRNSYCVEGIAGYHVAAILRAKKSRDPA